jgi:hypothetical protein
VRIADVRPVLAPLAAPLAAAVAVLALGGCDADFSQNDDVSPRVVTAHAGIALLYAGPAPTSQVLGEGECFATELLDRLTLDQLVDAEIVRDDGTVAVSPPMLDVDVAGAWVDAAGSCTPYAEVAARSAAEQAPSLDETARTSDPGSHGGPGGVRVPGAVRAGVTRSGGTPG